MVTRCTSWVASRLRSFQFVSHHPICQVGRILVHAKSRREQDVADSHIVTYFTERFGREVKRLQNRQLSESFLVPRKGTVLARAPSAYDLC